MTKGHAPPSSAHETLALALEEATGDAVVLVDASDVIVRWSETATRVLGIPPEEALGKVAANVLPLPVRAADGPSVFAKLAAGERWGAAPDRASARPPLVWTARPVLDASGAFEGAMYVARPSPAGGDRPVAEPASGGEAAAVRGFEHALEQMAVLDRERRVLVANRAFRSAAEKATGRMMRAGDDMLSFAAPASEGPFLEGFARALGGERVQRTRRVAFPNGQEFDHLVEYTPIRGADADVDAVLFGSVLVDALRADARSFELLDRGLAKAPFTILVSDARHDDHPVVYASRSVERLTGYCREEVLGKNPRLFQGRFAKQPALDVVRAALARGTACDVVLANERKDGSMFWNRLVLTPVRDEHGVLSHFVGIQEDVTEREELLTRMRAAQASETAQQMLGGAVHDLRNMLTVVSAQVGLAREDVPDGSETARSLDAASQAVLQAAALTRLLLAPVTRVRSMAGSADVAEVLRTVAAVCRYVLPKSIALHIEPGTHGAHVVGDRGALEQVLLNLVLNAGEAMPKGGHLAITVTRGVPEEVSTLGERRGAADHWTIAVTDTGEGMPEDVLARLFEPFFTTKGPGRGTGLGLATCARLVQAAGGFVRVRSRVSEGSTFFVTLPSAPARVGAPKRPIGRRSVEGLDILVVEADTSLRAALAATLRRRGATVHDAGDATVARQAAVQCRADAVLIVDVDRIEDVSELVREWLASPARSAIVLAGNGADPPGGDAERTRVARLAKPFDLDALLLAIGELVPERAAPASVASP